MSNYEERNQNDIIQDILAETSILLSLIDANNPGGYPKVSVITSEELIINGYLTSDYADKFQQCMELFEELIGLEAKEKDDFEVVFETDDE